MKIPSRIEGSLCGAISPNRRALWSALSVTGSGHGNKLRSRQLLLGGGNGANKAALPRHGHDRARGGWSAAAPKLLGVRPTASRIGDVALFRPPNLITARRSHTADAPDELKALIDPQSSADKQQFLTLVDQTDVTVDEQLEFIRDPYLRGYADANGPELTVSERREDYDFPNFKETTVPNDREKAILYELSRAISGRIRNPYKNSIDVVWRLYMSLPEPRMPYLHSKIRHGLFRVLGREKRESRSMLRYFAVVADVQNSGMRLTRPEWNAGISFAARYVGHSTEVEATAAMNLWKQMEKDANVPANPVTFNILFDVASKAGNFVLADMLYQEMEKRGLKYNRYHHVSLIHFFGLKQDSDGIRAAYKEMVEAGEMIDTVVLNCVMAGFLRCGEEDGAERVYERMKAAHAKAPDMPSRNYVSDSVINKVLMMFAKVGNEQKDPALKERFQRISPIVPNLSTYRILLMHYAVKMAALDKVAKYLDDMKYFQIPLHGAIFLAIFKGFAIYGGTIGRKDWSAARLKDVYRAFIDAFDAGAAGLYVDVWLVKWVLRAFRRTSDSEDAVWEIYEELSARWDLEPDDLEHLSEFVADLFRKDKFTTFNDRNAFYRSPKRRQGGRM